MHIVASKWDGRIISYSLGFTMHDVSLKKSQKRICNKMSWNSTPASKDISNTATLCLANLGHVTTDGSSLSENIHHRLRPFSGTTWVSRCQKKSCSRLRGTREDNKNRHTDDPAGRHSIWTNQRPTYIILHVTPNALPAATLPLYPGLAKAPNMSACIPSDVVFYQKLVRTEHRGPKTSYLGQRSNFKGCIHNCTLLFCVVVKLH